MVPVLGFNVSAFVVSKFHSSTRLRLRSATAGQRAFAARSSNPFGQTSQVVYLGATPGIRKWGAPVKIGGAHFLPSPPCPLPPLLSLFPISLLPPFPFPFSVPFPLPIPLPFRGPRPSPQTQLGGWGSAVSELPQRVRAKPGRPLNAFWCILVQKSSHLGCLSLQYFGVSLY